MIEGAKYPALAVHLEIPGRPNDRGSDVASEHGILGRNLTDGSGHKLGAKRRSTFFASGECVELFSRPTVVSEGFVQVTAICFVGKQREKGLQRAFHVANQSDFDVCPPADLLAADVDLNYRGVLRKELTIRKIRAEHEKHV